MSIVSTGLGKQGRDAGPTAARAVPALRSIRDTLAILGVSRTTLYGLINGGKLAPVKIGRRTLISQTEIDRFVADLSGKAA